MTTENAVRLLILTAVSAASIRFVFVGRNKGYETMAVRTAELNALGVQSVWLLYGKDGVGLRRLGIGNTSLWTLLNTGFLAYVANQQLVIEFPWWNKMRQFYSVPVAQLSLDNTNVWFNRRRYPALRIGDQSYVAAGLNIQDPMEVKRLLGLNDPNKSGMLQASFIYGINAGSNVVLNDDLLPTAAEQEHGQLGSRTSIKNVAKGTLLYLFLPAFIITALAILWAIITNQPSFR